MVCKIKDKVFSLEPALSARQILKKIFFALFFLLYFLLVLISSTSHMGNVSGTAITKLNSIIKLLNE